MENIYESLINLNVSEGCFESILSIVEEYLEEGRQEGESNEQFKTRLKSEVLPNVKARRRHYENELRKAPAAAKEANAEYKKAGDNYRKASMKADKAMNDVLDAKVGTDLFNKLWDKRAKALKDSEKAYKAWDKASDNKSKVVDYAEKSSNKAETLANSVSRATLGHNDYQKAGQFIKKHREVIRKAYKD